MTLAFAPNMHAPHKIFAEQTVRVDLRQLFRAGALRPDGMGTVVRGDELRGTFFSVAGDLDWLYVTAIVRPAADAVWRSVGETVPVRIVRTPNNYGGERLWLACPAGCGHRARILYAPRYVCATCARVTYLSRVQQRPYHRQMRVLARALAGLPVLPRLTKAEKVGSRIR